MDLVCLCTSFIIAEVCHSTEHLFKQPCGCIFYLYKYGEMRLRTTSDSPANAKPTRLLVENQVVDTQLNPTKTNFADETVVQLFVYTRIICFIGLIWLDGTQFLCYLACTLHSTLCVVFVAFFFSLCNSAVRSFLPSSCFQLFACLFVTS